jgi:hypothetical protein
MDNNKQSKKDVDAILQYLVEEENGNKIPDIFLAEARLLAESGEIEFDKDSNGNPTITWIIETAKDLWDKAKQRVKAEV